MKSTISKLMTAVIQSLNFCNSNSSSLKVTITTFRRGVTTGARVFDQPANALPPLIDKFLKVVMVTFNDDELLLQKFNDWITAVMSLEIENFIIDKKSGLPGRLSA